MYLVSHIFTVVMFSRSKMEKALLEQILTFSRLVDIMSAPSIGQ